MDATPLDLLAGRPDRVLLASTGVETASPFWGICAAEPFVVVSSDTDGFGTTLEWREAGRTELAQHPFDVVRDLMRNLSGASDTPASFVGYCAYDIARSFERIPTIARDDLAFPSCRLALFDHGFRIGPGGWTPFSAALDGDHQGAAHRLDELEDALSNAPARHEVDPPYTAPVEFASTLSEGAYLKAVAQVRDYIEAGDAYEVNLCRFLSQPWRLGGDALRRRLHAATAAPFSAYIECAEGEIVSASPELFLRVVGRAVETRPIKGTAARSRDAAEDAKLAGRLLSSPKDRAENVMAVDVARNDLGRVCDYGSVDVPSLCVLESHPHVHHLVSTVRGRLRKDRDTLHLLAACLPAASVTGAPKIRAMEIIEEIEPTRRGPYCGTIMRLGLDGTLEASVAIRTTVLRNGRAHFGVGSAITFDSDPQAELDETWHKAAGFIEAFAEPLGADRRRSSWRT